MTPFLGLRCPDGGGHTLVEILVVLAILAGLAAVVLPRTSKPIAAKAPPLLAALQKEQVKAAQTGQPVKVSLQKNNRLYADAGIEIYRLGPDERLQIEGAGAESYLDSAPAVIFYPDGTMTRAKWVLSRPGVTYNIQFSPFFGRIVVE